MGLLSDWLVGGGRGGGESLFAIQLFIDLPECFHVGLLLWGCSVGDRGGFCRRGVRFW